jgi:inosine triphosphate pyrophosphatase
MKIFISYAHADTAAVLEMLPSLTAHEVWFDDHLNVGQEWWNEIEYQIAICHCLLFVLSPDSMNSKYCQKELEVARKLNKPIAPVMIQTMDIPADLRHLQIIKMTGGVNVQLLNGLFEIERAVFNPLKKMGVSQENREKLVITDLYFATTSRHKKMVYEQILGVELQTAHLEIEDIQHLDAGEVALYKARRAFEIFKKPVFVEHSALCIRAWGGLPGGLSTTMILPLGLNNICKMMQPFDDKHAEAVFVIGFTDGQILRKFRGVLVGEIAEQPKGQGYVWDNLFIPHGFTKTLGEMTDAEYISISGRRRAMLDFMQFLQANYDVV